MKTKTKVEAGLPLWPGPPFLDGPRMAVWPVVTLELPADVSPAAWEIFCARLLSESACEGYEERQTRDNGVPEAADFYFEPAEGDGTEATAAAHAQIAALVAECMAGTAVAIKASTLGEQDWGAAWRQFYHATETAQGLWVGPPEERDLTLSHHPGARYVAIEYEKAFGTGGHATTRLCLELVAAHVAGHSSLLDIGTGTGVLCFASLMLGMDEALGMDIDPDAAANFKRNAEINKLAKRAHFILGGTVEEAVAGAFMHGMAIPELVVCNMLSASFDSMIEPLRRLRRPLILSGFLEAESEALAIRLARAGWNVAEKRALDEWGAWFCVPDGVNVPK
jgi:ribosomal protein L11 methyltransferase